MKEWLVKYKGWLIAAVAVIFVAVACTVALTCFRPQLASLYRSLRQSWLSMQTMPYRHYKDDDGKLVIYLDPGHGGTDPGAVSSYLGNETEATINYRLAMKVKGYLEDYGYTVKLAWHEGIEPNQNGQYPYHERIARANADPEADLYLCLHCNSFADSSVKGPRLYYNYEATGYNHYLAESVADGIEDAHGGQRPRLYPLTKETAFHVMATAEIPTILLEALFVSNPEDAAMLLDDAWLTAEAEGIAQGVHKFVSD